MHNSFLASVGAWLTRRFGGVRPGEEPFEWRAALRDYTPCCCGTFPSDLPFYCVAAIRQDGTMPAASKILATMADGTVTGQLMIFETFEAAQIAADVLNNPGPEIYGVYAVEAPILSQRACPSPQTGEMGAD